MLVLLAPSDFRVQVDGQYGICIEKLSKVSIYVQNKSKINIQMNYNELPYMFYSQALCRQ